MHLCIISINRYEKNDGAICIIMLHTQKEFTLYVQQHVLFLT
jgi:hypothetical protein